MRLSISNIGWNSDKDNLMYETMADMGYQGLEIAPTRIFAQNPYDNLGKAEKYRSRLKAEYRLQIASIQSIWYGRTEHMFGSKQEREGLLEYTKKAIRFAEVLECPNLVFGCPKNRVSMRKDDYEIAVTFFSEIGQYAREHNTVLAMEANPTIYHTNFINTTEEACNIVKKVACEGFRLNLDLGTCIQNEESLKIVYENKALINHVHISEPCLKSIERRMLHKELREILQKDYQGFVSIEMEKQNDLSKIYNAMTYVKEIFG